MDDIERIKQKIDIVDLIQEYIPLKKMGRNFKAVCPFHSEKTPSFVVSPERQIWHCFGCSKGGDQFGFLMEYEKIEFPEALRLLAAKAGITLSSPAFTSEREKKKELLYELNHLASNFYHFLLVSHPIGKKGLSYLTQKRKISLELINKFNLGYAPAHASALSDYLVKKKNYEPQDLVDAGLSTPRGNLFHDFFTNRIIFPIYDVRGNVIAFSGRSLDDPSTTSGPKYINTKETPLYRKGDSLYGLYFAKDEIRKQERAIVVEGEFDVISSFREGIMNVVAVKGTALTENQIKLLKRYAEKISFCFDTDFAGIEAQRRSIEMIEKEGISSSVVIPPQGKDPDELLQENPALFKNAIKRDTNIYDFIIESSLKAFEGGSADGKKKILEKTLPFLVSIDNEVVKEHYFKKLANVLDTSLESLLRQAEKMRTPQKRQTTQSFSSKLPRQELLESYLLSLITQSKDVSSNFHLAKKTLSHVSFSTPALERLFKKIEEYISSHKVFSVTEFATTLPSELTASFDTAYLAPLPALSESKYREEIEKTSQEIKALATKETLRNISSEMQDAEKRGSQKDMAELQERFNKLTTRLNEQKSHELY